MVQFLDQSYRLKEQIVPCLVGPVGIGKTAAVLQHAENVGAKNVVTIIASQILPSEVSGITMPDKDTKSMEIYDHYRLSSLQDGDILFFDELLEADQCVLSACLTLIESRQMMSGKKLPNIQIVAATNPTIDSSLLRENIRQRFMFMKFGIDRQGVHDYIMAETGIDLPNMILAELQETSNQYNILSPRSLTKLCKWVASTEDDDLESLAMLIDGMWASNIGHQLKTLALSTRKLSPKQQIINVVKQVKPDIDEELFEDCTMEELLNILQGDPDWLMIMKQLENTTLDEDEEVEKISF